MSHKFHNIHNDGPFWNLEALSICNGHFSLTRQCELMGMCCIWCMWCKTKKEKKRKTGKKRKTERWIIHYCLKAEIWKCNWKSNIFKYSICYDISLGIYRLTLQLNFIWSTTCAVHNAHFLLLILKCVLMSQLKRIVQPSCSQDNF